MRKSLACLTLLALLVACGGSGSTEIALPRWPSVVLGSPNVGGEFGRAVAFADECVAVGSPGRNQVHIYDATTGRLKRTLRGGERFGTALVTRDGELYVGVPRENRVVVHDLRRGHVLRSIHAADGEFGAALALHGEELWVGAPTRVAGRGVVERRDRLTGELLGTLTSSLAAPGGAFGSALASSEEVVAIGAPGEGRVHLAQGGATVATLAGPVGFGTSVAQHGLWTLVGSPSAGLAHLYLAGRALHTFGSQGMRFGLAVTIDGPRAIVAGAKDAPVLFVYDAASGRLERTVTGFGAAGDAALHAQGGRGIVGIFHRTDGSSGLAQFFDCCTGQPGIVFESPALEQGGAFGLAVEHLGSLIAVSQPRSDQSGTDVHLFGSGGSFVRTLSRQTGWGQALERLGSNLVIGAPFEDGIQAPDVGAVYIVDPVTGSVVRRIGNPQPEAFGSFGRSIAAIGNNLLVGAPGNGGNGEGVAYLIDSATGSVLRTLQRPAPNSGGEFGYAVAAEGNDLFIGAPSDDQGEVTRGLVHKFSAASGAFDSTFASPDPNDGANRFGHALAAIGGELWVGAPLADHIPQLTQFSGGSFFEAGRVYVLDAFGDGSRTLQGTPVDQGLFGESLDAAGDRVVVGAPAEPHVPPPPFEGGRFGQSNGPSGPAREGSAYLFDRLAKSRIQRFVSGNPVAGGFYGIAVAIDAAASEVLIGAPGETVQGRIGAGHCYLRRIGGLVTMQSPNTQDFGHHAEFCAIVDADHVLLGSPSEFGTAGRAYLADLGGFFPIELADPAGDTPGVFFGRAVLAVNGALLVGAPGANKVVVFDLNGNPVREIPNPLPASSAGFGSALASFDANSFLVTAPAGGGPLAHRMDLAGNVIQTYAPAGTGNGWGWDIVEAGGRVCISAIDAPGPGGRVGGVHVYNAQTGALLNTIFAPDPTATQGQFGLELASYNGALLASVAFNIPAGAVWLIDVDTGAELLRLFHPDGASGGFGRGLAQTGDLIAVGSFTSSQSGEVFLFSDAGGLVGRLASPNPEIDGFFGHTLAGSPLGLLVSAYQEDVNPVDAGRAYFFSSTQGNGGGEFTTLQSPNPESDGGFGSALSFAGTTLSVGAPGESSGRGRVYLFSGAEGEQGSLLTTIESPNRVPDGAFGTALASNPLFLSVGAPGETSFGVPSSGRAYLLNPVTGAQILAFQSANPQGQGGFGSSIAVAAANVAVGAPFETVDDFGGAGRVYYFDCVVDIPLAILQSPNPTGGGGFGAAVATFGTTIFVGAPGENAGAGVVYVFDGLTGALLGTIDAPDGGAFGRTLHLLQDRRLVVSAPDATSGSIDNAGRGYLIDPATRAVVLTFDPPNPEPFSGFGLSLASKSDVVGIGSPFSGGGQGRVTSFLLADGSLNDEISSPSPQEGGLFGFSIVAVGDVGVVGAPGESASDVGGAGIVYVNPGGGGGAGQ